MRMLRRILIMTALITALRGTVIWAQQPSVDQVVDRIVQRENEEIKTLQQYDPIVETYVQDLRPDNELGMMSITDHYFLGRAVLSEGTVQRPSGGKKNAKPKSVKLGGLSGVFANRSAAEGFLNLIYVDSDAFDRQHYRLDYVRREFLDEVRCLVFDVAPLGEKDSDRYWGRIWFEDRGYTIVHFNGANSSAEFKGQPTAFSQLACKCRTRRVGTSLHLQCRIRCGRRPFKSHFLRGPNFTLGI